jgi:hypothetical protein
VNWRNPLNAFHFDNDLIGDDEIWPMLRDQLRLQLDTQCCFANGFRQPWAEYAMYLYGATNDSFREFSISIKHDITSASPRLRVSSGT